MAINAAYELHCRYMDALTVVMNHLGTDTVNGDFPKVATDFAQLSVMLEEPPTTGYASFDTCWLKGCEVLRKLSEEMFLRIKFRQFDEFTTRLSETWAEAAGLLMQTSVVYTDAVVAGVLS
jgi:hypothetical protein